MPEGKVFLVGGGPGDPGLLTVRGADCLARADVVIYDYLVNPALLEHAPAAARRVQVGKHGTGRTLEQEEINAMLIAEAKAGRTVIRLKGGDPFVFGRGGEEAEALEHAGVAWEVVPGVTAAVAAAAYAGIPLTHRDLAATVCFATGHERWDREYSGIDWDALAKPTATAVLFMSVRRLGTNLAKLIEHGRDPQTPAVLVEWGTLPRQRVVSGTLANLEARAAAAGVGPPAVLIVGAVARLRERLAWLERRPLHGRRVLILRARGQAGELAGRLRELGAEPVVLSAIQIAPPESFAPLDEALVRLGAYDWVVFTSQNAVRSVFERLDAAGRDARAFGRARVCAIGDETAAQLRGHGVAPDLVPAEAQAEGLVAAFAREDVEGRRFLLPRAAQARETFPEALRLRGAQVDVVAAYRTLPADPDPEIRERVARGELDAALFASASQVVNFFNLFGSPAARLLGHALVGAIGPVTAEALRKRGVTVAVVPRQHTTAALAQALANELERKEKG
jgi:uroporphyrinogen III methyltransferase/synthase